MTPQAPNPWSAPVSVREVPETGRHIELLADEPTRAAVAALAGLSALPRLSASFDVVLRGGDGLRVTGHVSATVGQTCVVTLEPIENPVEEDVDLVFTPDAPVDDGEVEVALADEDAPEPLVGGVVDLGALATEFLMLGIDPYPRKEGATLDAPSGQDDDRSHPFAALEALKDKPGGK
jgi:uncharacterized metal-binding protein YceD (DUF177 family)